MYTVYKITNKKTNFAYVGCSTNVERRFKRHFYLSCVNAVGTKRFAEDKAKFRKKGFNFKIIAEFENKKHALLCEEAETDDIKVRGLSYNINSANKPASETLQKNREAHFGKVHTASSRKKLSEASSGKNNSMYGKKHSLKTRQLLCRNHADISGENNPRAIPVTINGVAYPTLTAASNATGIPRRNIRKLYVS